MLSIAAPQFKAGFAPQASAQARPTGATRTESSSLGEAERIREQATVALLGLGVKEARPPPTGGSEVSHG
jgi:hypothetical protein